MILLREQSVLKRMTSKLTNNNVLRFDPTRSTLLRRQFMGKMQAKFKALSRKIQELVVDDDVFGISSSTPFLINQERQAWRFRTNANKVTSYRDWLQKEVDTGILTTDAMNEPWTSQYVGSAYKKGMSRAYTDVNKATNLSFYEGNKEQFLQDAFRAPEMLSKIELIYTRTYEQLRGVTASMSQQMSRILADGLSKGEGPATIAKALRDNVTTMTNTRALTLARTEIIHAHAEGQLDSFERLGIEEVGMLAEFSTAQDERVCAECDYLESGGPYPIAQARGMIPAHPNCRCAWVPVEKEGLPTKIQRGEQEIVVPMLPQITKIPFIPATKLDDAEAYATKYKNTIIPKNVKDAVDVQDAGTQFRYGAWKANDAGDIVMERSLRENWSKALNARKGFQGLNYKTPGNALKDLNKERILRLQNAINDNGNNLTYRAVLSKHSGSKQPVILRRPPQSVNYAAEQIGGTSHVMDSVFMDDLKDFIPLPGKSLSTTLGGLQSALRHEYGHTLYDKAGSAFKKEWISTLTKHSADEIEKGITKYAVSKMYIGDEAFCELFAMRTSRLWDASKFPAWVQDAAKKIEEIAF